MDPQPGVIAKRYVAPEKGLAGPAGNALFPVISRGTPGHFTGLHIANMTLGGRPDDIEVAEPVHCQCRLESHSVPGGVHPPKLFHGKRMIPVAMTSRVKLTLFIGGDRPMTRVPEGFCDFLDSLPIPIAKGLLTNLHRYIFSVPFVLVRIIGVDSQRVGVGGIRAASSKGPRCGRCRPESNQGRAHKRESPSIQAPSLQAAFVQLQMTRDGPMRIDQQQRPAGD